MGHADRYVIAVYSPKGGVGKTTLAVDMAWRCATQGEQPTLLWDLDPQAGSGYLLDVPPRPFGNAAGIFQKEGRPEQLVIPTQYDRLSILRADDSLRNLPWHLARIGRRNRLAEVASGLKKRFGRIVLDCSPMQNEVSYQVLAAADVILVPLPPSPLSARALDLLQDDLERHVGRHAPILPILSMYDGRRREHRLARTERMADFPIVPLSAEIERSAFYRAPIGAFAGESAASDALNRLWMAVERKLRDSQRPVSPLPVLTSQPRDIAGFSRLTRWLAAS